MQFRARTSLRHLHAIKQETKPARLGETMPSAFDLGGLSKKELAKRVWNGSNDDDVFGRSAQLAYSFLFAIFPALIFVASILGIFAGPGTELRNSLMTYLSTAMPGDASNLVQQTLGKALQASSGGTLVFGIIVALWSASSGMAALEDTLNAVYDVKDERPFWKSRGVALLLTIASSVLAIVALAIILFGNDIANMIGGSIGLGGVATWTWKIVQWPIAVFFLLVIFAIIYYYAPNVEHRHWQWISPGATLGVLLWLAASFAFRVYLHYFNSYNSTYGTFGAVMILMLWFYITGVAILMGAEINAEIENAAAHRGEPTAKEKGEKRPQAA